MCCSRTAKLTPQLYNCLTLVRGSQRPSTETALRRDLTPAPPNAQTPPAAPRPALHSPSTPPARNAPASHTHSFHKEARSDRYTPGARPRAEDMLCTEGGGQTQRLNVSVPQEHDRGTESAREGGQARTPGRAADPTLLPDEAAPHRETSSTKEGAQPVQETGWCGYRYERETSQRGGSGSRSSAMPRSRWLCLRQQEARKGFSRQDRSLFFRKRRNMKDAGVGPGARALAKSASASPSLRAGHRPGSSSPLHPHCHCPGRNPPFPTLITSKVSPQPTAHQVHRAVSAMLLVKVQLRSPRGLLGSHKGRPWG